MTDCSVRDCDRPVDDAHVCSHCNDRLAQALGDVPALTTELDVALRKAARFTERNGSRTTTRPLPLDLTVSRVSTELRSTLLAWTVTVVTERGVTPPADTTPALSRFLLCHTEWLRHYAKAQDAHEQITDAVHRVWRVIDRPQERIYIGPCNECGRDLYVKLGAAVAHCRDCELDYDVSGRREFLLAAVADQLATAHVASRALTMFGSPVGLSRIYRWARNGQVQIRHDARQPDVQLFRVGDLTGLVLADMQREQDRAARRGA